MANIATSPGASAPVKPNLTNIIIERVRAANDRAALVYVVSGNVGFDVSLPACLKPKPGDAFAIEFPPGANPFTSKYIAVWKEGERVFPLPEQPKEHTMQLNDTPAQPNHTPAHHTAILTISHLSAPALSVLIPVTQGHVGDDEIQTVNARELHAFLEVKSEFRHWIKNRIAEYGFVEGIDYVKHSLQAGMKMAENGGEIGGIGGVQKIPAQESMGYDSFGQQGRIEYALTLHMAKELSMVERNEKGKQARQYFLECERRAKSAAPALPNFVNPAEAAIAWAEQYKAREAAEARALEAEKTKALIGSKREATAMATASKERRRAESLAIELDQSKQYATVKRMEMLHHGLKFNWWLLKAAASEMGMEAIDVFDANYGTVKAWPAEVWKEAFALDIPA